MNPHQSPYFLSIIELGASFVFLLVVSTQAIGQDQVIKSYLDLQGGESIRIVDRSHIFDGRIIPNCIQFIGSFPTSDTVGVQLELLGTISDSLDLTYSLYIETDTFTYHIRNQVILNDHDSILSDTLFQGDSIILGRTASEVVVLHNELVIDTLLFATSSEMLGVKILVHNGSGLLTDLRSKSFTYVPPDPPDTMWIEFSDTLLLINEGQPAMPCVLRGGGSAPIDYNINLISDASPHFNGYGNLQIIGSFDTICSNLNSDAPNGIQDDNRSYIFELVANSPHTMVGNKHRLRVEMVDDQLDSLMALCPGQIMITAVDNDITENDKISLTTLKPLHTNTTFSLATAVYEKRKNQRGRWYASDAGKSVNIASQAITYTGSAPLPTGSVICLSIPASGTGANLFVGDFEINGVATNDFTITNNGNTGNANINLLNNSFTLQISNLESCMVDEALIYW